MVSMDTKADPVWAVSLMKKSLDIILWLASNIAADDLVARPNVNGEVLIADRQDT